MRGEELPSLHLDDDGVAGDRRWALLTAGGRVGAGKRTPSTVRLPHVLDLAARTVDGGVEGEVDGGVRVTLPGGTELELADPALPGKLAAVVGEPVTVAPRGRYRDLEPVHLVTTASVRWWADQVPEERADWRRLRPNVVVEAPGAQRVEDAWVGKRLRIGTVTLRVVDWTERCLMAAEDQLDLGRAPRLLRALARRGLMLGVYARVTAPGEIRVGDPVEVS